MLKSELLLPAGSLVKLKTAIMYGADAVYAGLPDMSLRTQSKFDIDDLREGIEFVRQKNKKIYLTLNLFAHNAQIAKLPQLVATLRDLKPDGVLISDVGIFDYVRQNAPELDIFISTQANVCSSAAVHFWQKMGAKLCVLGREVSFGEMAQIRHDCPDIKLETFIHGAMCMSYSGRCLISNFLADRSANMGKCAHCCRWHYKLHIKLKDGTVKDLDITEQNKDLFEFLLAEDFRPNEYYELQEDENGSYILNSKDMCLMPRLNQILDLGIDSLKVEGRNKTEYYAGTVARAYRQAIDDYQKNPADWSPDKYMAEILTLQNRGYCLGFFDGHLTNLAQKYVSTRTLGDYLFAGSITDWEGDEAIFELRNCIESGETIEFLIPNTLDVVKLTLREFEDASTGEHTTKVSAGQNKKIRIKPEAWPQKISIIKQMLPVLTLARKFSPLTGDNKALYAAKQSEFAELLAGK